MFVKKSSKIALVVAVIAGAGLLAVYLRAGKIHETTTRSLAVELPIRTLQRSSSSSAPIAPIIASNAASGVAPHVDLTRFRRKFASTANFADFIQSGINDPEHGGYFYSAVAYQHCLKIGHARIPPPDPSDSPERVDAKRRFESEIARCAGVLDQFGENGIHKQLLDTRRGKDPLLPENGRGIFGPPKAARADADLLAARGTEDPNVVALVLEANIDALILTWMPDYSVSDASILYKAVAAVTCELRGDCIDGMATIGPCAISGVCDFKDYRKSLVADLSSQERKRYEEILEIIRRHAFVGG